MWNLPPKAMNNEELLSTQELYEHFKYTASEGQEPLRVDKFLMNFIEKATRNKVQQAAKAGGILVNGVAVKSNHKVKANDEVSVVLSHPPHEYLLTPENIPLDIIYEDEELVVVNKPASMVVHPGHGNYKGTLLNGLLYHFEQLPVNQDKRPGLVHRIDKGTSGLLVVAKTEYSMAHLSKQFFDRSIDRTYMALVWGNVKDEEGRIEGNIGRSLKNRLQMTVFEDGSFGKKAITHYKVLERLSYVTLLQCKLETGRTHQIRVHLKHIGHTLFNDERYGGDVILKGTTFTKYRQFVDNCFKVMPRLGLHAQSLGFEHPTSGKHLKFEIPPPQDFENCLMKWRGYAKGK